MNRVQQRLRATVAAKVKIVRTLSAPPTPVLAAVTAGRLEVDFLPIGLSDVRDVELPGHPVKGVSLGVSQAIRPNFVVAGDTDERVTSRNTIGAGGSIVAVNVNS